MNYLGLSDDIVHGKHEDYEEVSEIYVSELVQITSKAVLFLCEDGEEHWIPKSLIVELEEGTLIVASWFAEQEGFL